MRFIFAAFVLAIAAAAWADFQVPELTGPIVDNAHLFQPDEAAQLSDFLRDIAAHGKVQIQVLTVPNLGGEEIEQASIQVTDKWKLGKAGKDNGVLIMITKQEHKMRIEVGQGLEGNIPDAIANRIIYNTMRPLFRDGQFAQGTYAGIVRILSYADPGYLKQLEKNGGVAVSTDYDNGAPVPLSKAIMFIFMLVFLGPWLFFALTGGGFWGGFGGGLGGFGGFGGGGFGGFGGGGWGGGGGGFSGGGASGGW